MDQSDRRCFNRKKRRIPCHLWVGEREHSALVLDLSPTGLFVQTRAKTRRGDQLELRLPGNDNAVLDLVVEVVRVKQVPQMLVAAAKGGIGVRIVNAPEEYFQMLEAFGKGERSTPEFELELEPEPERRKPELDSERKPEPEIEPAPRSRFQVYVGQTHGSRSRRVIVMAPDTDAARACALEQAGEGWRVLRVESV